MSSAELPFTVQNADGVHLIDFRHNVTDPFDVERSNQELHMLVESLRHPKIVLNLRRVDVINSRLIGVIMGLDIKVLRKKGQLRICNLQPKVLEVFALTRLTEILQIHKTMATAIDSLE